MLERVADVMRELAIETPPNVGGGVRDALAALMAGNRLRRLDLAARRDVLDLFTKSAGQLLDAWFESAALKAAFGFDAIVGNFASPYTPGSAYVLLHHVFGEVNGKKGAWGHAVGGMGAITQAMAAEARARGVEIINRRRRRARRWSAAVLRTPRCSPTGREIAARCVVSNLNPKLLYLNLIDASELDADFLARMRNYRCESATLRMNVALAELPDFSALPGRAVQGHHQSGIIMAPSLAYMERAYFDARTTGWSHAPDRRNADSEHGGRHARTCRSACRESVLPAFQLRTAGRQALGRLQRGRRRSRDRDRQSPRAELQSERARRKVLSPLDLERDFGLIGGDIFHGALTLDQLYSARPVLGYAAYRGPLARLYMCGAGTHPGGGVSGVPGMNAAREIVRDWRAGRLAG